MRRIPQYTKSNFLGPKTSPLSPTSLTRSTRANVSETVIFDRTQYSKLRFLTRTTPSCLVSHRIGQAGVSVQTSISVIWKFNYQSKANSLYLAPNVKVHVQLDSFIKQFAFPLSNALPVGNSDVALSTANKLEF